MDHFNYRNGELFAEDVAISEIAAEVGTPFYVYSTATIERHIRVFDEALNGLPHLVCYAMKANSNLAVLRVAVNAGAGLDVVSEGELHRAIAAGCPGDKIVFSGVGKTHEEMRLGIEADIRQFNIESEPELERLNEVATSMGRKARITIRVNPDVDAKTHAKIATGKSENKFGIPIAKARDVYAMAAKMQGIDVVGIDVHIGSQLTELEPYQHAFEKVAELTHQLRADGHNIQRLDLGGGLGIPYQQSNEAPPLPFDYGQVIQSTVGDLGCEIEIEPGRLIAGNAGLLIAKTIYRKEGEGRDFLILDAAMNDLIRPAMYEAWHDIIPVKEPGPDDPVAPVDIVGPVCESGDTFAKQREMAMVKEDELVAFRSAGAYGAVMSSEYNSRPLIPEVLVNGSRFDVVRPRPTYDDMLKRDRIPDWLK